MKKLSNINLDINDFGPINNANIELKKLNVIAGINGSGKTTSSKLLYSILTSISSEKDYLTNKSIEKRLVSIRNNLAHNLEYDEESLNKIIRLFERFPTIIDDDYAEKIKKSISALKIIINDSKIKNKNEPLEKLNILENVLEINEMENRRIFNVSNTLLKSEFKLKELKLNNPNVNFYEKLGDSEFSCKLANDGSKLGFKIIEGDLNSVKFEKIIYSDSASVFDSEEEEINLLLKNQHYHLRLLSRLLNIDGNKEDIYDPVFNQKLDEFKDEIAALIEGYIFYDDEEDEFKFKMGEDEYSMKNTASGVKQLGIIQRLLSNRTLNENSFLIMDEPEVNLHPEWQVKFAELIVLMVKELDLSIFINSHSPQFIEALEVYSAKYELSDESKFYLSKESESGKFDFEEILRDELVILYNNLGNSYNEINKIRAENMRNGIF